MIDLTPLDIRKKKTDFTRGLRGYDMLEVDHFLDLVAERLEEVVKVNLTLRERVDRLAERVQGQEGRERAVQEALVTAQSLKHEIEDQAEQGAELVRGEAEREAERVRREADGEAERVRREAEGEAARVRREADGEATRLRREADGAAETVRTEIKSILEGRAHELVELNRARTRFIEDFRDLLERELGVLELAESDDPSDEFDLDVLQFGKGSPSQEEAGGGEANQDVDEAGASVTAAGTLDEPETNGKKPKAEDSTAEVAIDGSPVDESVEPEGGPADGAEVDETAAGAAPAHPDGGARPQQPRRNSGSRRQRVRQTEPDSEKDDAGPEEWGVPRG